MPAPDPASVLARQIRDALRFNEIGDASPYQISFAGSGRSGGSFGAFQADCCTNGRAKIVLWRVLATAGVQNNDDIVSAVSVPCPSNPLSSDDTVAVNAALASDAGRPMVDALDETTVANVLQLVGTSIDAAASNSMTLDPGTACAIACWANMSGAPSTLNGWLRGAPVRFPAGNPANPSGPIVSTDDALGYLALTGFYAAHPRNLNHLRQAVAAGLAAS